MHTLFAVGGAGFVATGGACGKAASSSAGVGRIAGRVTFVGAPPPMPELDACGSRTRAAYVSVTNEGVKDAVVRLGVGDLPRGARPPAEPAVIDQRGCQFQPHVLPIVSGQKVAYRNSDATMHDVHTYAGGETDFHDASRPETLDQVHDVPVAPGGPPYEVRCDAHPWMEAHILVGDQPYAAVTSADGAFVIDGVPAGKHGLELWHPHLGTRSTVVIVEPGKTAEAVFAPYQAKDYKAP